MSEIVLNNMSEYPQVLRRIFQYGERRSPRGLPTIDLGFTSVVLLNPLGGMPLGIGRSLNPAIGAVEAIQLIAGISDPELVLRLAPQMERYTDPAEYDRSERMFWGAYGERIKMQAHLATRRIELDPDTRQAVITLWDPWLDNVDGKHDYPCTIALQFFVHDAALCMNTIMRSNDAWLGLPYDIFQFTQLQSSIANALHLESGVYRHTALSLHLYETNRDAAMELLNGWSPRAARESYAKVWQPDGIGRVGDPFTAIMGRASDIIRNITLDDETNSERWYRERLHGDKSQAADVG